jgi:large subunit ribosomal protein L28
MLIERWSAVSTAAGKNADGESSTRGIDCGLEFERPTLSLCDQKDWSTTMAAKCELCGKGPQFGNNISHANNTTRRRWNVNLRPVKAKVEGASKRIRVCTSCIKTGKVVKG